MHFEPVEPRLLLSATLTYGDPSSIPLPSDLAGVGAWVSTLVATDYTLKAEQSGSDLFWRIYATSTNTQVSQLQINDASELDLTVRRADLGASDPETGLDLLDFAPDTFRIDLASLAVLNTFANGHGDLVKIEFDGGSQALSFLGFDDDLILQGSGVLTFGLSIKGNADIAAANLLLEAEAITIESIVASGGLYGDTVDDILGGADSAVVLDDVDLVGTSVTLRARSNVVIDTDGIDLGPVSAVLVISDSDATVELKNGSSIAASGALALNAAVNAGITASTGTNSFKVATVIGGATPEVLVDGGTLSAGAGATLAATSTVDIVATTKPNASSTSTTSDAAVAVVTFDSAPRVELTDNAALTVTGGTTSLSATDSVMTESIADGRLGGSAGGTLGVAEISGDTVARVKDSTITSAGAVSVAATSVRTVTTTAHATPDGAKQSAGGTNESEKRLEDPNQDGNTADRAQTGDGADVGFAAAVALSIVSGDSLATLDSARIAVTGASGDIGLAASARNNVTTTANGAATSSSGAGVGVGVAIGVADVGAEAWIRGTSDLAAKDAINVSATIPQSNFVANAKSGASGGGSGLGAAGALVVNVTLADARAGVAAGASVDLNGSNLVITASATTDSNAKAEAGAAGGGSSLGMGASVAINYAENETQALVDTGATLNSAQAAVGGTAGGTVGNVTLTATSDHGMKTEAVGGAEGGTAITPVAALSFATYDTLAQLRADSGVDLVLGGALAATASHAGDVQTTATGKTSGDTAVGASFALAVHGATALANTQRDIVAGGNVTFTGSNRSNTKTGATASAKGSSSNGGSVDQQADNQRSAGNQAGTSRGGKDTSSTGSTPSASTSDGNVAVAAAVAINVVNSDSTASVGSGLTISAGGNLSLLARNNTDTDANASGEAVSSGSVGVGAAVALNAVDIDNHAGISTLLGGGSVTANGVSIVAEMRPAGLAQEEVHRTTATAVSGAGGKNVGVAGSVAVNVVDVDTVARRADAVSLTLGGGDVMVRAESKTASQADALPKDGGASGDVGVGASVSFQKIDTLTQAEIGTDGSVAGTANDLTVAATGDHTVTGNATHGAAGDTVSVGGSVAIALVTHETTAEVAAGAALGALTGDVAVTATHDSDTTTATKAKAGASSVGVGAGVGINIVSETVGATLARSVTTTSGVTVASTATVNAVTTGTAAAGGSKSESDGGKKADAEANEKVNSNANKGAGTKTVPKAQDAATTGADKANAEAGAGSGGASGVGVAAAIAVNAVTVDVSAATAGGADITASGAVRIGADVSLDAKAQTDATAVDFTNGNVNVGAAVSLNVVNLTQQATVGTGSAVRGSSVTLTAETTGSNRNDFSATAYAVGGNSQGAAAVGATIALNVVNQKVRAHSADGSSLTATGGGITVSAEHDMGLLAASVSGGVTVSGNAAVGGSVAMNLVNVGDSAASPYDSGTFASIGDRAGGGSAASANATGVVTVKADSLVDTLQLDLPASINNFDDSDSDNEIDDPDIHLTSAAIAAGASGGSGAGVGASVVVNWFKINTEAAIDNGANVSANALAMKADDEIEVASVAGSIGVGVSGTGVGAGVDLLVIERATNARVGGGATVTLGSGASSVVAESDETLLGVSANAGVGGSVAGVAGSASVHVVNMQSGSGTHATVAGNVTGSGDFTIRADGEFADKMVAGSVGVGSNTGVGAANTTLIHAHNVSAGIADGGSVSITGLAGDLTIDARSAVEVLGITATASAGNTAAVGGAVTVGVLGQQTDAYVGRGATASASLGNASVLADADTVLTAVAGNVNFGGTAGVGVGVDVGVVNKSTTARMESAVTSVVGGDLRVVATSSEDITSAVAGLAASGTAAVAANPSIHTLNLTTLAHIGDDPAVGPGSSGAGNVSVSGSIEITADDATEIDKLSAAAGIGGTAGIGLAASVSVVNKRTEAFIGAGAKVDAKGFGAGVTSALGVIVPAKTSSSAPTVHADASSQATVNGDAASVGASANVGAPRVGGGASSNANGYDSTDAAKGRAEVERTTQLASTTVYGIAISATNRDDVASYSVSAGGSGTAGIGVSGAVTVINTDTRAYVDDNARVNDPNTDASGSQSVRIGAGNDFEHVGIVVGAGGGTVGVGAGLDVTVLNATTEAFIDSGARVRAANDVTVDARSSQDVVLVNAGVAGGYVGVGGTVGVLTINDVTNARIRNNAIVSAGDSVAVRADDQTETVTVDGAVAGGFVGVGAAVGVLVISKDTSASIGDGAQVDALGTGGGLGNTMTGDYAGGDAADGFARGTSTGIVVQATSREEVLHIVVAGGGGFVGVGGAVGVVVVDSDTVAEIGNARINQNTLGTLAQDVTVNAGNETRLTSVVGGIAGGAVGVGAAVDVGVVRNDVGAFVRSGAKVRAGGDVEVNALAIKELDGYTAAAAGGAAGVSGAVSVWSIGTDTLSGYDADGSGTISQDEKPGETASGLSADEDAGGQSEEALAGSRSLWSGYGSGSDPNDPNNRSRSEASAAASGANARLGQSDMPSQAGLVGKVGESAQLAGTQAIIEGGTEVLTGGGITVNARADVEIDMFMGQLAIGVVGGGGAVGIVGIQEKVEAVAAGTMLANGAIDVYTHLDSEMNFISVAGNGGAVALGASVVVLTDSSVALAKIGESAVIDRAGSVSVRAESDRQVTNENTGISAALGVALGASVGVVEIGGEVKASVGADARIGQGVNVSGSVGSLNVRADANEYASVDTTALALGIGTSLSGTVNVGTADLTTAVTAELGAGAQVTTTGDAVVDAVSVMDADVGVFGVAVGGGAVAASIGTAHVAPNVTAASRGNSKLQSTSGMARVRATHNEGVSHVALVETTAGSGGVVVGGAGSVSDVEHDAVVRSEAQGGSQILASTTAEISAFSGAKAHADAGSLGIGALAMGTSVGEARVGGSVNADFQGATMSGQTVRVYTETDLAARGTTVATTGGVIGASVNQATATVTTGVTSRVGSGQLTATGNAVVEADANARAYADSGGIETDKDADWPNLSLLGSIGLSASDATLDSSVRAQVGAATVNAGGQFVVKATHNEGTDQRAYAQSSASGGSLGVSVSGADSDATASADVVAEAGGPGASFTAAGGVVIRALAVNQAEAIVDAFGLGGIGGIGASDATAKTDGSAEARTVNGTGATANQKTTVRGSSLTIDADTIDRARAIANGAGGGLFVGGSFNESEALISPRVVAELGNFADVVVGGALAVTADAATEGDAKTEGSQGGSIAIGDSNAYVRIGDVPNIGDRITVRAAIGDGAEVEASSLEVRARHNDPAALDWLQNVLGGTTNGISKSDANSSGGGAVGVSDAYAETWVRTDVDAVVGAGASIDVGGSVFVTAVSNAIGDARGTSAQGGLGAFGTGDGRVFVRQNVDAAVGAGARIAAGSEIRVTAADDTDFDAYSESSGGGAVSTATANSSADIESSSIVTVGSNADLFATRNIVARSSQTFGGELYSRARSYGAGAGANGYMDFALSPATLASPSVAVNVASGAKMYAQEVLVVDAVVDGRTVESRGDSDVVAVVADTDSEANTNVSAFALINVGTGAVLTGEDRLEVKARVEHFLLDNGDEARGGIEADGVGGSDSDADSYFNASYRTYVMADDGATFASRDLEVRTTTATPGWGFYLYAFGLLPDASADGSMNLDRRISWDADVILLSAPNPELTVEADGTISRADNVTVNGGLGVGENVGTVSSFTVDPIVNDDPGRALFEANAVGNPFADDDIWDEYEFSSTSEIYGDDGTWYARRTFDRVELVNHSAKKMIVGDIFPIDRDGDPDGEVFINVDDRDGGTGKDPFNFRIVNQFEPTLITITSTSSSGLADIEFAGEIDNPIGHTVGTGGSDILSDGSQLIRSNLITLSAQDSIGRLSGGTFADLNELVGASIERTALRIDLVQSNGRPENLDATAGGNIVLDLRGSNRSTGGGSFTVNLGTLDAGRNVDVFMLNAIDESIPAGVGSYALIVDENNNEGAAGGTPGPLPYIQFFKPDSPEIVFDFWKNLTAPLGVFGTYKQAVEATYDYQLVQAGRVFGGADIRLDGQLSGVDVNIRALTNIFGSTTGLLYALTDGDITLEESTGDMRLGRVKSTEGDVTLTADVGGAFDIIDVESADHLSTGNDATAEADVSGRNVTLTALKGLIGEKFVTVDSVTVVPVDFIEIDSSFSGTGVVTATALKEIYLDETQGAMNLALVRSVDTDVVLHTRAGAITDGNGAANNIRARSIDLVTVGGGVGSAANDVEIDTDEATLGGTSGRLYATATANGAVDAGIFVTEIADSLDVLRARTDKGDMRLSLPDTANFPLTFGDFFVLHQGENLVLLASGVTLENQAVGDGRIEAERDIELRVGDNVELTSLTTNFVLAGRNIDIRGDWGNADAGIGTVMNLRGEITSDATSPLTAKQVGERTRLFGHTDDDRFNFLQLELGGDTYAYGSQDASVLLADDGEDRFFVDRLQDLTTTRGTYVDSRGNVLPVRDALTLDGQADTDTYRVVTHGSLNGNGGVGGISDYVVNALDTGAANDGVDTLTIDGSADADIFLLRGQNYIPGHAANKPAFVALLHGDLEDDVFALGGNLAAQAANPGSPYLKVERVNYDQAMNGRLIVYGYAGGDYFASDDNSVVTTLDGGAGDDRFQIGQLYRSEREYDAVTDADDFADATVLTTRGYLSRGISAPMTIYGGTGNDNFSVYSNKAELRLEGNEGNDDFIIRAFALETGQGGDGKTLVDAGEGDDNIQYNINAPVSIDGGPGFDRVVVLGTEFADNFVITEDGIFGAGLKVTLAGNEELREIDGLEGDDNFWVLGTPFGVATRIIGGLGSDDVHAMGDVTGVVVSRDLEGVSSGVEHAVTADPLLDPLYNGLLARGVDLNIATAASGQIVIQEPDERTVVSESQLLGATTDMYEVFLSSAPTAAVYVTVSAVRSPQQEEDGSPAGDTMLVSADGVTWQRAIVLTFNAGQSGEAFKQQVHVKAVNDLRAEGPRTAVISHSSISADANFNFVAIRNVEVDIVDDDKAGIYVEESFAKYDNGTQVLEGAGPQGIADTYSVRLASAPIGNTTVQLNWDATELAVSTADTRYDAATRTITFDAGNWFQPVVITLSGLLDGVRENREIVPITHTVTSSADTRYVDPATPNPDVAVERLKVSIVDADSEGVLVTESFGRTLVVQDDPATPADEGKPDTYTVRLTKAPVGTVTVTTLPLSLPDKDGGLVQTVFTLPTALQFDATNWWIAQEVTVTANPQYQPAPGTEFNKQFTKRDHRLSELFGPLEFLGGIGPEDRSLVEAVLLPGETNRMDSDGNVLTYAGSFVPGALDSMVVEKADLQAVVDAAVDDVDELAHLVGFSLMITEGPGLDRFWQIKEVVDLGNGQVTLTLQNPGRLEARWNVDGPPTTASEYAIVNMSANFFVDEATQIDKLNVFNDTSAADDVGTVTVNRVYGLGMGPGVAFDTNEDNVEDLFFASGISYASYTDNDPATPATYDDVEVLDLMLGRGNDLLTVQSTLKTTALHGGLTVVHGGGNTPLADGTIGGDTINVLARNGGSPLVVFGDTSADGYRYSGQSGIKSPNAMNFAFSGRDTLDASASNESVTMYGGRDDDLIIGSSVGDHLAGGSGDDRIFGLGGNDHLYGDSGVNIDVNTRRLASGMAGPTVVDIAWADAAQTIEKTGRDRAESYAEGVRDDLTATLVNLARPNWADTLDGGADLIVGGTGNDIVFGDHGIVTQFWALAPAGQAQDVRVVGTGTGAFGTANERLIESRSNTNGQGDTIFGNEGDDLLIGGAAGDRIDGNSEQDLIFGDNASLDRTGVVGDATNPRFRVLQGTQMYSTAAATAGTALVTGAWQVKPGATPVWTDLRVELLDHSFADEAAGLNNFGNDYIAGGAHDDQIFGQLGHDTIQGDGSIGEFTPGAGATLAAQLRSGTVSQTAYGADRLPAPPDSGVGDLVVAASVEAASDGDDYVEGNGGNDVIFGNLGQDDIVGGTSTMFGETTRSERPDGADLIFGGAGTPADIARNSFGDAVADANGVVTVAANGHARDADMILGDNGDIHRLVGVTVNGGTVLATSAVSGTISVAGIAGGIATSRGYLAFNYDVNGYPVAANGGALRVIPRTATLVDYTPGGPDYVPGALPQGAAGGDVGAGDEIHGEAGDDFVYGMTGNDTLFGEGQNDDLIGGWGADWISGGTGDDGVIGDDGRLFTSRNSATYGEALAGVVPLRGSDPDTRIIHGDVLNEVIYTPGNVQTSTINVANELKKAVDLTPFNVDPAGASGGIQNPLYTPRYANDIIFGGLGNDWLHGGAGDDAISGAEALGTAWTQNATAGGALDPSKPLLRSDYSRPFNTGHVLRFNPDDPDGWHFDRTRRAGEFALYDEYDPLRRIMLNADGSKWTGGAMPAAEFLLNFNADEGRAMGTGTVGGQSVTIRSDGDDRIFGALGNDWLVGGTGRDQIYGGYGNDLLNADDNHTTNGSRNDQPDTAVSYEDRAFGGGGRDVLIANTGGDRLIDWVGEFNSYLVPFAPFGTAVVSRTLQPQLAEFLYAQSRSDGADFTRAADTGSDPARNGEPYGELGLLRQTDRSPILQAQGADFHSQTGAPADPQAGNIPGGKRDVLRSASFDQGQPENLMADSGLWEVSNGRLQVSAKSTRGDAVAVYHVGDALPSYFELTARISTIKPTSGWNANSYVIFDYVSYNDFKFAGINVSTNKLEIGHRTAAGWTVLSQTPFQAKAGTFYDVLVAINGLTATVQVGNVELSQSFAARVIDDFAYGLNWGLVGFGSNNARGSMDSIAVMVVPPTATVSRTETFTTDAGASFADLPVGGTWAVGSGRYVATPASGGTTVAAMNLNGVTRVASTSLLELSATLNTANRAGIVFDRYGDGDYKFAAIDVQRQQLLIGHVRNGVTIVDAAVSRSLTAGVDYTLNVALKGNTVSVTLVQSGTSATLAATSFVFNAVSVDGRFGLFASGGTASFDSATVRTNDPSVPAPLSSAAAAAPAAASEPIERSHLDALFAEAVRRWATVEDSHHLAALSGVDVVLADLPTGQVGAYHDGRILIDVDADGHGWFVDLTPGTDEEFLAAAGATRWAVADGIAAGRVDLLSVLSHEVGHAIGLGHTESGVMAESLLPGQRATPELWYAASSAATKPASGAGAGHEDRLRLAMPVTIDWSSFGAVAAAQAQDDGRQPTSAVASVPAKKADSARSSVWQQRFVAELGMSRAQLHPNEGMRLHLPVVSAVAPRASSL